MNSFSSANPPGVEAAGWVDLHCHLLPGVDDGCQTLAETLACVEAWIAEGFSAAAITPHMGTNVYPDVVPGSVAEGLEPLRAAVKNAGWNFDFHLGGEVRLSKRVIPWFEEHGVPALGEGRCVLVDWWSSHWPSECDAACAWLRARGYQPILAHPERMGLAPTDLEPLVARLQAEGVWLQGNLNSLAGGEGHRAQQLSWRWLREGRYHVLASDTHGPDSVPTRAWGLRRVREELGDAQTELLLRQRPKQILAKA